MSDFITVKATNTEGKVALFEQNPEHPGGEAFVYGDGRAYKVAKTPLVNLRLSDRMLVETTDEPDAAPVQAPVSTELQAANDRIAQSEAALAAAQKPAEPVQPTEPIVPPADAQARGRKSTVMMASDS